MKSVNRWESTFLRRVTVVVLLPFMIVLVVIVGAWLGISTSAKEVGGAMWNAWKGAR